jgi:hypothetical protein
MIFCLCGALVTAEQANICPACWAEIENDINDESAVPQSDKGAR